MMDLEEQFSPKNTKPFSSLTAGSDYNAFWVCPLGHEYQMRFSSKMKGQGCPYCSNRKVLPGFNDLATTHPHLVAQWHPRNLSGPEVYTHGSGVKTWWLCEKGHEWETKINSRTYNKTGCPVCAGKQVLVGFNDLTTTHPSVASQWHPTRNEGLEPESFTAGSRRKVWWLGECGHEWETQIHAKALQGTKCPHCSPKNNLTFSHAELLKQWSEQNTQPPESFTYGSEQKAFWVCEKNHEWETSIRHRTAGKGCPVCATRKFVSKPEKDLQTYLTGLGFEVETNLRNIIPPYELDLFIPEKQFAVEFNGLYWHTEKFKPRNYHYDKWLACGNKSIQLIQIWEDDWNHNPELVKRMLAHKLGVSQEQRVYARDTQVAEVAYETAAQFLNKQHIQGQVKGTLYLGLQQQQELVAVCVLMKQGNSYLLSRYATKQPVVGGFSKLLKHIEKTLSPEQLVSFSDNTISDGGLYRSQGFTQAGLVKPDYMYVVGGVRKHKFGYRLKKFRDDPNLLFQEGLTEKQLAVVNGLERVWDAGKIKWVKKFA